MKRLIICLLLLWFLGCATPQNTAPPVVQSVELQDEEKKDGDSWDEVLRVLFDIAGTIYWMSR